MIGHRQIEFQVKEKYIQKSNFLIILDEQSNTKLLFYIVTPMSFVVFMLSLLIILLLTKSNRKRRRFHHYHRKKRHSSSSTPITGSYTYTNNVLYRTNNEKLFVETKNQQRLFPIKSELSIPPISCPVYSTSSSHSLPPLVTPSSASKPPFISPVTPQPLSVRRLYKSYV